MKRILILLAVSLACAGIGRAAYRAASPAPRPLSQFVPAGPLLYLEAKDFSSLLKDWNSSAQKRSWLHSDDYQIFSRSRLFLRLQGASQQFAAAAGFPPDMDFLSQVAGERSALALYDIGKLQFLYITTLPSAQSLQSALWQTRSKFEPRNAAGTDFYTRRDPESEREVAFAVSGNYLLLATREDLMAGALQLMAGQQNRTVETDSWWAQSTSSAGDSGDLRMVLDLQSLVPNGYFRTYWVQQNITDLSQYSAGISDLFRTPGEYREERVLLRKKEGGDSSSGAMAAADLARLIPDDRGAYVVKANPSGDFCFSLLQTKLLAPHVGLAPASQIAPHIQLTSGEQGSDSDLETRIDQSPASRETGTPDSNLKSLLGKTSVLASLQIQSTQPDPAGVFVRIHSAVVLSAASDWNEDTVFSAVSDFIRPELTAGHLGVSWAQKTGYRQMDGLWPLTVATHGKYLIVTDDPALMEALVANEGRKAIEQPANLFAGFSHRRERDNFSRFAKFVDRPAILSSRYGSGHEPQFFSGNLASLSATLQDISSERIEVHDDGPKVRQKVIYEWSQ